MSRKNVGENWNFATTRCNNIFTSAYKVSFRFTRKDRGTIEHDLRISKASKLCRVSGEIDLVERDSRACVELYQKENYTVRAAAYRLLD